MKALAPPAADEQLGHATEPWLGSRLLGAIATTIREGHQADLELQNQSALEDVERGHATLEQITHLGEIGIGTIVNGRSTFRR